VQGETLNERDGTIRCLWVKKDETKGWVEWGKFEGLGYSKVSCDKWGENLRIKQVLREGVTVGGGQAIVFIPFMRPV